MKNNASMAYAILLIIGDFLALIAAFTVAYILRVKIDARPLVEQIKAKDYIVAFAYVLPLWILVHSIIGLYSQRVYEKRFTEIGRLLVGSVLGILVVIGFNFVTNGKLFPARLVPVYGLGLGFSFLVLFRTIARLARRSLYAYGIGVSNVLIVGNTKSSSMIAEAICNTKNTGQQVLGIVSSQSTDFTQYATFRSAVEKISQPIHSIIQTELYKDQDRNDEVLSFAQKNHAAYRFVPGNTSLFVGNIEVELFAGQIPMIAVHQTALVGWGRIAKRLFDIFVSLVALLITSPLFLIIGILEATVGGGFPIFFRQVRLTRFNNTFTVFKFRTHRNGLSGLSDKQAFEKLGKPDLYKQYKENGYALDNDPRLTRLGSFLRKTSLDELPQLINVLRGDISLVGPRPLIPEEINTYDKKHMILSVKSGLTGLAQVSGRQNISFEERRKLDMYYVQNWTFWGDIVILVKTAKEVFLGSGAL
ncbi:MAG: sugar transferase [Candidatus Saccharibacteria bacterium]